MSNPLNPLMVEIFIDETKIKSSKIHLLEVLSLEQMFKDTYTQLNTFVNIYTQFILGQSISKHLHTIEQMLSIANLCTNNRHYFGKQITTMGNKLNSSKNNRNN